MSCYIDENLKGEEVVYSCEERNRTGACECTLLCGYESDDTVVSSVDTITSSDDGYKSTKGYMVVQARNIRKGDRIIQKQNKKVAERIEYSHDIIYVFEDKSTFETARYDHVRIIRDQ